MVSLALDSVGMVSYVNRDTYESVNNSNLNNMAAAAIGLVCKGFPKSALTGLQKHDNFKCNISICKIRKLLLTKKW